MNPALINLQNLTEREQVDFAAKAVGLNIEWPRVDDMPPSIMPEFKYWRPRTNGDDALALAAALDIQIEQIGKTSGQTTEVVCHPRGRFDCAVTVLHGDDKVGATRLAIFYAAVLLGMSIKE
jgi:hypothetical protein